MISILPLLSDNQTGSPCAAWGQAAALCKIAEPDYAGQGVASHGMNDKEATERAFPS